MNKQREQLLCDVSDEYRKANALQSLSIAENDDGTTKLLAQWNLYQDVHQCTLTLAGDGAVIQAHCDCHWMKDYGDCPHIRLCHEYIQEKKDYPLLTFENPQFKMMEAQLRIASRHWEAQHYEKSLHHSDRLLRQLRKHYDSQLTTQILHIQYALESRLHYDSANGLCVSFRVGNEVKYIIKSVPLFIKAINEHQDVTYGQHLHFVHEMSAFDDFAKDQIEFMRTFSYHKDNRYEHDALDTKVIKLNHRILDEFFTLYEHMPTTFRLTTLRNPKLPLSVEDTGEYLIFHIDNDKEYFFGEKHLYSLERNGKKMALNRYLLDEEGLAVMVLKELFQSDIVMAKADYSQFAKYGFSALMRYVPVMMPELKEAKSVTKAELYGDVDEEGRIYFELYYVNDAGERFTGMDEKQLLNYEQDIVEAYLKRFATKTDEEHHRVYMDEDAESTLIFLSEGLQFLNQYCEIYVSDLLKRMNQRHRYRIRVQADVHRGLLSLDIECPDIPDAELAAVLSAYQRQRKFYRLKSGHLISLVSDELRELSQLLDECRCSVEDCLVHHIPLAAYRIFSLEEIAKDLHYIELQQSESFQNHIEAFYQQEHGIIDAQWGTVLRDYQKEGVHWLLALRAYGFGGILADDMGLGKTLQIIAYWTSCEHSLPALVITSASLIYNWDDEIKKFRNDMRVLCVSGNAYEREECLNHYREYDMVITSYDYIRRDIGRYQTLNFDTVVLDEAQYIKNHKTQIAMAVKRLRCEHRFALSGTPIENSLAELWSLFDFLMPDYLYSYPKFQTIFEIEIIRNQNEQKRQLLKRRIAPFLLRRTKQEVLKELPDKIEHTQIITFSDEEWKLYAANARQMNQRLRESARMEDVSRLQFLAMLTRLRELCCEPRLIYGNMNELSSKLKVCLELIENLQAKGKKVLVFSSFVGLLKLLEVELKRRQIAYVMFTGRTNKEKRRATIHAFQTDPTLTAFLISLKAGGTGLNLTAAEAVIHFDPWWNTSSQNQATDRAYRIGQHKNVQVFQLIMKDSIEEKIMRLQHEKKELADLFVEGGENRISSMSKEDLLALISVKES